MRVGLNTLFLLPGEVGGSETYVRETVSAMPQGAAQWVVFTNFENDGWFRTLFADRSDVSFQPLNVRASCRPLRILAEQLWLPRLAKRAGLDVLWSPGYTSPVRLVAPPSVPSVLDVQYRRFPEDFSPIARRALDGLLQWAGHTAAAWITLSDFSRRELAAAFGWPLERIHVTPLAAGADFCRHGSPADVEALQRHGIERPYLLCVAHTHPHKNVEALIAAHGRIAASRPHHLVIVGRARRGEAACRAALSCHPHPERVRRIEWVSATDLAALYRQADWFVFPSRYEGFGLPVLEAMAAGAPVITTRCGAIPEVAGNAALYADSPEAESLSAVLTEALSLPPAERQKVIEHGHRRAQQFSWKRTAELTLDALRAAGQYRRGP